MLPDFPDLKDELHKLFMTKLKLSIQEQAPLIAIIPRRRYHEGEGGMSVREDGSVESTELEEYSADVTYDLAEIKDLTLEEAFSRYQEIVGQVAKQQEKTVISRVSEAARSVGNQIDARGKELSPDHVLEMLETVRIDFNEEGNPIWPTLVLTPVTKEKMEEVQRQLEEEPYKSRMEELVQKKRQEWNDRESSRKLVD